MTAVRNIIVAAAIALAVPGYAREASEFFADAPASVINIFDRNSRLDMLDYHNSGLSTPTNNVIGGKSRVTFVHPGLVSVEVSDRSRLDIALIKNKKDTIVAVIETVKTPIPDSSINLYRTDWTPLPSPELPRSIDFINKKKQAEVADGAPLFDFISIEYMPEDNRFLFTNHTADYYYKEELPEALRIGDRTLIMAFDGKKFVKAK